MPTPLSAAELPVFDAHVDSLQRALDLGHDLGREGPGHLDLARGRRGGLGAVVLVCWADPGALAPVPDAAFERSRALLGELHALLARHPGELAFGGNGAQLERARAAGRTALIAGIEGGHSIEGSLAKLEWFFERGLRVMTLVWNNHLDWIRSCQDGAGAEVPEGLSDFGRAVVRRMNELGVLVDLSHAGERSFYDAVDASERPVIASHSGCRALHDHPRNLTDDQLRALAANGGVVGMPFLPGFLDADAREEERRVRASEGFRAIAAEPETARFLEQGRYLQRHARPLPLARLVDHALHAIEVAGIEHVGLGSDFDGIDHAVEGLEDASRYMNLAEALLARGLDEGEVRLVLGGNLRRAFAAATGAGTRAGDPGTALVPLERSESARAAR